MPDCEDDLERRLAAVERAIDGEQLPDQPCDTHDTEALESRLATLESRVDELDAAVQAIRGFLGGVSAVNEAVERRADAAVAAVERLESRLDGAQSIDGAEPQSSPPDHEMEGTDGDPPDTELRERLRSLR